MREKREGGREVVGWKVDVEAHTVPQVMREGKVITGRFTCLRLMNENRSQDAMTDD